MREYKYKTKFVSTARGIIDAGTNKFLSVASLDSLKSLLPKDSQNYPDLLAVVGNACTIGLFNQNGDGIDKKTGITLFPYFQNKFLNLEHDDTVILGHISTSHLTKFNVDYPNGAGSELLTVEEANANEDPANIAISGYIYESLYQNIASKIKEANDPTSPHFMTVSLSWQMGFDTYKIAKGSSSVNECSIIDDGQEIEKLSKHLKAYGGNGKAPDGQPIYRLITYASNEDGSPDYHSIFPLGVSITLSPAAEVAGIVTADFPAKSIANSLEIISASENKSEINENKISQIEILHVTPITTMNLLTSLAQLKSLNDNTVQM